MQFIIVMIIIIPVMLSESHYFESKYSSFALVSQKISLIQKSLVDFRNCKILMEFLLTAEFLISYEFIHSKTRMGKFTFTCLLAIKKLKNISQ